MRPPKGFAVDSPHIEAIKLRHFFAMVEINLAQRSPKDLAGKIAAYFEDLLPLMQWLRAAAAERAAATANTSARSTKVRK